MTVNYSNYEDVQNQIIAILTPRRAPVVVGHTVTDNRMHKNTIIAK